MKFDSSDGAGRVIRWITDRGGLAMMVEVGFFCYPSETTKIGGLIKILITFPSRIQECDQSKDLPKSVFVIKLPLFSDSHALEIPN